MTRIMTLLIRFTYPCIYHCAKGHYPPGNHHASHFQNVLFAGHNHILTTGADDPTL